MESSWTAEAQSDIFDWTQSDWSSAKPMNPPRYLVPVMIVKLRFLKAILAGCVPVQQGYFLKVQENNLFQGLLLLEVS
jgi:hypothetical protein